MENEVKVYFRSLQSKSTWQTIQSHSFFAPGSKYLPNVKEYKFDCFLTLILIKLYLWKFTYLCCIYSSKKKNLPY